MSGASQPAYVEATFFAQVEPRWRTGSGYYSVDATGHPILEAAKAVGLTQDRPRKPKPGTVLVKLTLRIPAGAFLPLAPEAIVVIPEEMTVTEPIEVTAGDARELDDE